MALTTNDKIGIWAIVVAILVGISAFFIHEIRQSLGFENSSKPIEKVKAEPSNVNIANKSDSNTNNLDSESFSQLQQTSAQEIVGWQVIATGFDVVVNESNTIITIPFKLKDEDYRSGKLYGTRTSYLADPNGKLYNIIKEEEIIANTDGDDELRFRADGSLLSSPRDSDGRILRQHEVYKHKLIFQKLVSKPQFLYFHYNSNNDFPPIKLMLNWTN